MSADPNFGMRYAAAGAESAGPGGSAASGQGTKDHGAHAGGNTCGRCEREIRAAEPVRRRANTGDWVHEACPVVV